MKSGRGGGIPRDAGIRDVPSPVRGQFEHWTHLFEEALVPIDVLYRLTWVVRYVETWSVTHTLASSPCRELHRLIRVLAGGRFSGIIVGLGEGVQALLFVFEGRICGARLSAGDLRGHDALAHVERICERLTWTFREAPSGFEGAVLIIAGIVGEGGKRLVRRIGATMSDHVQAIGDLKRSQTAYVLIEPAEAPTTEWLLFCTGPGHVHRFVVGPDSVELPAASSLDEDALKTIFRRQKTDDELYEAVPRFYSPGNADRLREKAARDAETRRLRLRGYLLYLLPVLVVALFWGGWKLFQTEPPRLESEPVEPQRTQTSGRDPATDELVLQLQQEIIRLRRQMQQSANSAPTAEATSQEKRSGETARRDSLQRRVAELERIVERTEAGIRAALPPVERPAISDAGRGRPSSSNRASPSPRGGTGDTVVAASDESPVEARQEAAYTETLVDTPPEPIESPAPAYPPSARSSGVRGQVLLSVLVNADGSVREAIPLRGDARLRRAAVDGVRQWRFRPAILRGIAVPCWKRVSVSFQENP